jgi:outer membrane protein assembly factor BamB
MKTSDLVFIGIKGSVVALNRTSGEQVWVTKLKGYDFVNIVVQNDTVLASCYGEIFCLDPLTGTRLWQNPLKGFGVGLATIATAGSLGSGNAPLLAAKRRRDEEAAAASTTAVSL